jgi:GGDEF domain-containing protein
VKLEDVESLEQRYGHGLVDAAVKMTARTVDFNLGPQDTAARWDRTELRIEVHSCWGVGLSDLTAKLRALTLASELQWWGDRVRVNVSIVGVIAEPGDSTTSLEARISDTWPNARTSGEDLEQDLLTLGAETCLE